jgi:hypothetical protein
MLHKFEFIVAFSLGVSRAGGRGLGVRHQYDDDILRVC